MRTVLFLLCAIPFWTPGIIRTIAWISFLGTNGTFNQVLLAVHFTDHPLKFLLFTQVMDDSFVLKAISDGQSASIVSMLSTRIQAMEYPPAAHSDPANSGHGPFISLPRMIAVSRVGPNASIPALPHLADPRGTQASQIHHEDTKARSDAASCLRVFVVNLACLLA